MVSRTFGVAVAVEVLAGQHHKRTQQHSSAADEAGLLCRPIAVRRPLPVACLIKGGRAWRTVCQDLVHEAPVWCAWLMPPDHWKRLPNKADGGSVGLKNGRLARGKKKR